MKGGPVFKALGPNGLQPDQRAGEHLHANRTHHHRIAGQQGLAKTANATPAEEPAQDQTPAEDNTLTKIVEAISIIETFVVNLPTPTGGDDQYQQVLEAILFLKSTLPEPD